MLSDQANLTFQNGRLLIDGEQYKSKINPPTVRRILTLTNGEKETYSRHTLRTTPKFQEKGSIFFGIALNVASKQKIRTAYTYLKIKYADAIYILCA